MKAMARQRSHSIEFKRQVAQEFIAGETLYGLSKRHDISRQLIRVWVQRYEAGALDEDAQAADLLQAYETTSVSRKSSVISLERARASRLSLRERDVKTCLVVLKLCNNVARGSQSKIAVRPDEIEGIPSKAGPAGGGAPGKPLQAQPILRASLLGFCARLTIDMRLPIE